MTRPRLIALAAGLCLPIGASAQGTAGDAHYCGELIKLYRTYINNPEDPRPTFVTPIAEHEVAIANCKAGRPAEGIPTLEKVLRDNGFTLPPKG
jgi:hypothetical protein